MHTNKHFYKGLSNVITELELIEDYKGIYDVALALHVCGPAADSVQTHAQAQMAYFLLSPCCVGKVQKEGMKSVERMKKAIRTRSNAEPFDVDSIKRPRSRWMRGVVDRESYMSIAKLADWSGHAKESESQFSTSEIKKQSLFETKLPQMCKAAIGNSLL